ncbi:MAG TPA: PEP-CTERM sorting domain-containing protein [Verrucomicrobiota bacterium]|nr:PEP-CTERM sorting domain-containing protein [Verrucomicrobiota bacterium]HQL77523.1 PEP-CTERM sorting domain-containing protein [Verrucomicrobiota bacterium]
MQRIVCLMAISCCAVPALAAPYYFQSASGQNAWIEVDGWAGAGANETILVVDWNFMGGPYQTESHAFGFRWDGTAYESDMLDAFNDAAIFDVTSGYGGAFLYNIAYNDGTDAHLHTEEGGWNPGSTANPYAEWGAMSPDWTKLGEWDANQAAYDAELLQDGYLEGINAVFWYGEYPLGQTFDDYPLDVPFAIIPEPSALALCTLGGGLFLLRRKQTTAA